MSFRDVGSTKTAFPDMISEFLDFRRAVEDGDYDRGPKVFDVPFQIGNLVIDTPRDETTGQTLLTITNVNSGNTVTLVSIP